MTWLPIAAGGGSERDAVLGLHAEAYEAQRAWLQATAHATDTSLLDLCRVRLAQALGCREELARHDTELLVAVEQWYRSDRFTDLEHAALEFTEQFMIDPSRITNENVAALEGGLGSPAAVIDFANALSASEAAARLSTILDLEPDLP